MRDAYAREGVVSMIVFPLTIRGQRPERWCSTGVNASVYRDMDIQVGTALANLVAAALTAADLYDEQRQAREAADQARQQAAFLAEAGTVSVHRSTTSPRCDRSPAGGARRSPTGAPSILSGGGTLQRLAVAMSIRRRWSSRARCRSATRPTRALLAASTK